VERAFTRQCPLSSGHVFALDQNIVGSTPGAAGKGR